MQNLKEKKNNFAKKFQILYFFYICCFNSRKQTDLSVINKTLQKHNKQPTIQQHLSFFMK